LEQLGRKGHIDFVEMTIEDAMVAGEEAAAP
jgi:hypothetical protein